MPYKDIEAQKTYQKNWRSEHPGYFSQYWWDHIEHAKWRAKMWRKRNRRANKLRKELKIKIAEARKILGLKKPGRDL